MQYLYICVFLLIVYMKCRQYKPIYLFIIAECLLSSCSPDASESWWALFIGSFILFAVAFIYMSV